MQRLVEHKQIYTHCCVKKMLWKLAQIKKGETFTCTYMTLNCTILAKEVCFLKKITTSWSPLDYQAQTITSWLFLYGIYTCARNLILSVCTKESFVFSTQLCWVENIKHPNDKPTLLFVASYPPPQPLETVPCPMTDVIAIWIWLKHLQEILYCPSAQTNPFPFRNAAK